MLSFRVLNSIKRCHLKIYFSLSAVFIFAFLNIAARPVPDQCQFVFTFSDSQTQTMLPVQPIENTNSLKSAPSSLKDQDTNSIADSHRHLLFDKVGIDFNQADLDKIYGLNVDFFLAKGLGGLLKKYDGSPFMMLWQLYPDRDLKPWKFTASPKGTWSDFQSIEEAPKALRGYLQAHGLHSSADFHRHILLETLGIDFNHVALDYIYGLNFDFFRAKGLDRLLKKYDGSLVMMLSQLYPDRDLKPWKFAKSPQEIWSDFQFIEEAPKALRTYLQAHDLHSSADFHRHVLFDTLGIDFNHAALDKIYALNQDSFRSSGLRSLLGMYDLSPFWMLWQLYPDLNLKPWKFTSPLNRIWSDFQSIEQAPKALRGYLQAHGLHSSADFHRHILFETFDIDFNRAALEDIYSLGQNSFRSKGLISFLEVAYDGSPSMMLLQLYPDRGLKPWKFASSPQETWSDFQSIEEAPKALRGYLQAYGLHSSADFHRHILFETFDIDFNQAALDEIYVLGQESFSAKGLLGLLNKYDNSPSLLLSQLYPDRGLEPWKFAASPNKIWSNFQSIEKAPKALRPYLQANDLITSTDFKRHVLLSLCRENNVETIADCANFLSHEMLHTHGISGIQPAKQSINEFLSSLFGLDKLELLLKKKTQRLVTKIVRDLFHLSNEEFHCDYKSRQLFHTNPRNPHKRGNPIEFDIYVPKLGLAIEVHGIQHIQAVNHFGGEKTFARTQETDAERREKVRPFEKANGGSLIFIEIWHSDTKNKKKLVDIIKTIIENHTGSSDLSNLTLAKPGAEFIL